MTRGLFRSAVHTASHEAGLHYGCVPNNSTRWQHTSQFAYVMDIAVLSGYCGPAKYAV